MSNTHGAASAAGHGTDQVTEAPDDGFDTAEERQQWAEMQAAEPVPVAEPPPADGAPPPIGEPPVPGAAPATDDDDDGEDEPAAAGAPPVAGAPAEKIPRRVSYSKYKRETEDLARKVREAEGTISEQKANQARLDERLKIINEALSTPQADPAAPKKPTLPKAEDDPEPDPEADIFAHSAWMRRELARTQEQVSQGTKAQQQERQTEQAVNALNTEYLNDANTFASTEPNFAPAYKFLMDVRTAQLAQYHFGKDLTEGEKLTAAEQQQIARDIAAEERGIIQTAKRTGKGLAASVYKIAKASGYRPQAAGAAPAAAPATNGAAAPAASAEPPHLAAANGRAAPPAPAPSVKDEIDRVKNGQDAALSLSNGGGAPAVTLDVKRLVEMSDEDFGMMVDSMSPAQIRALGG